jgi:hypothetical protein
VRRRPWLVIGSDFSGFAARDVDITVLPRCPGAVIACTIPAPVRD